MTGHRRTSPTTHSSVSSEMASPDPGRDVPNESERSEPSHPEPACQEAQKWIEVSEVKWPGLVGVQVVVVGGGGWGGAEGVEAAAAAAAATYEVGHNVKVRYKYIHRFIVTC